MTRSLRTLLVLACVSFFGTRPLQAETIRGLNVSTPLALSGSFGFLLGDPAMGRTPAIEVEAGIGGYKLMAGVHNLNGKVPTSIRASYLHTWFEPIDLDTNQSYLGLELQAGLGPIIGSVGGYARVSGSDESWIATFGLGLRF